MVAPSHFLSTPQCARKAAHRRTFQLEAFERVDGLLDLEILMEDTKSEEFTTKSAHFPCGVPVHLMALRLTVNESMDVVAAEASMQRMPFPDVCTEAEDRVKRLVGTNLLRGFWQEVAQRIGANERCSHLSEIATLMPTLAIQAMFRKQVEIEKSNTETTRPLKIGGCHAWREDGVLVQQHYPRWHVTKPAETKPSH